MSLITNDLAYFARINTQLFPHYAYLPLVSLYNIELFSFDISGYYVERKAAYASRFSKVNGKKPIKKCELLVDDLEEGVEYEFRVMAENAAGVGEPCEPITLVAKDPFGMYFKKNKKMNFYE